MGGPCGGDWILRENRRASESVDTERVGLLLAENVTGRQLPRKMRVTGKCPCRSGEVRRKPTEKGTRARGLFRARPGHFVGGGRRPAGAAGQRPCAVAVKGRVGELHVTASCRIGAD